MYDLSDTIVAVSSPPGGVRSIVRIAGPETLAVCEQIFEVHGVSALERKGLPHPRIQSGSLRITQTFAMNAHLYLFLAPKSYTGEDLAEIHLDASPVIVEALLQSLLARGLRLAGPGEFTARAYLNGKLDLAQAEAVNEVITSSNRLQLEAAERLLGGRLTRAAGEIRSALLDILSLVEAGLDFSGEQIEFISPAQAVDRLVGIQDRLAALLAGSIRYETLIDLPAVGIAGAPNAGKSSLLNALLGWERSIISAEARTTRDVLSGVWKTDRLQCVLFDCAGLISTPEDILDKLAQQAAIEALQGCRVVLFCVDAAKSDWSEDLAIRALIQPRTVILLATKCDLLAQDALHERIAVLAKAFGTAFLPVSTKMKLGLESLHDRCASALADGDSGTPQESGIRNPQSEIRLVALTARHKQAVIDATEDVRQAAAEIESGNEEVAAMMIRTAHQTISEIEHQPIDEQVLDRIFTRFCIGK